METKPETQALLHATQLYLSGDLRAALDELGKAEQLARAAGNNFVHAGILVQRASWLRERGKSHERRAVLAQLEQLVPQLEDDERNAVLAGLRLEQGIEAMRAGDFAKAEKLLREAETEARNHPWGITILSDVLANLGALYSLMGCLKDAQTKLQEAIQIDRELDNRRALANDLNVLALTYDASGDRATADLYLKQAIGIAMEGGFMKEAADAVANSAVYLEEAERFDKAQAGYQLALTFYEQIGNQVEAVNSKSSLAIVAFKRGDAQTARKLLTETVTDHSKVGDQVHAVYDLINLAQVELDLGDEDSAYAHATNARDRAKSFGMLSLLWAGHWLVARARAAQLKLSSDLAEQVKGLNDILASYEDAAEALEWLRAGIGRPEEREHLLLNKEDLYGEALIFAGILRRADTAFAFSERARARAFLDRMGPERIQRKAAQNPLVLHRESLTKQIMSLRGDDESAQKLYDELRMVRAQIAAEQPAAAAITEAVMPSYKDIGRVIPEDTGLVEFFVGPGRTLTIFVLKSKEIAAMKTLDLGNWDLAAKVEQFRAELKYEVEGTPTGGELFLILLGNVWNVIDPLKRLLIVPHRELHYIPFSALWFKNSGEGPEHLYLCQRFTHTVLPSAAFLPLCLNLARPRFQKGRARVLANPSGDLSYAEQEGAFVAAKLGVSPLTRGKATRAALLQQQSDLGVVHVASHGVFDESDPLLSGVEMVDGRVTAEDIMESNLATSLLTLSGCVTGLSKREPGDELIGLSRAAASAGIPSVVTSLWEVFDESSSQFFAYFYNALGKGASKDWALLAAQQALMQQKRFEHPVHWAPFVLLGDWR